MTRTINVQKNTLRIHLDDLVKTPLEKHLKKLDQLSESHTIHLVREMKRGERGRDANCHEHTFGLEKSEIVASIAQCPEVHLDENFINWLIANILNEISLSQCQENDFIIYLSNGRPTHSGIWNNGRVRSKWGNGHLWEHAINEVPLCYGGHGRLFKKSEGIDFLKTFLRYVKQVSSKSGQARVELILRNHSKELSPRTGFKQETVY